MKANQIHRLLYLVPIQIPGFCLRKNDRSPIGCGLTHIRLENWKESGWGKGILYQLLLVYGTLSMGFIFSQAFVQPSAFILDAIASGTPAGSAPDYGPNGRRSQHSKTKLFEIEDWNTSGTPTGGRPDIGPDGRK